MFIKLFERNEEGTIKENYKTSDTYCFRVLRYCPHCNSDLYGEWKFNTRKIKCKVDSIYYDDGYVVWPENEYMESGEIDLPAFISKKDQKAINDITPLLCEYYKEKEFLKKTNECPICRNKLCNDNRYLYEGTRPISLMTGINKNFLSQSTLEKFNKLNVGEEIEWFGVKAIKGSSSTLKFMQEFTLSNFLMLFQDCRKEEFLKKANSKLDSFINSCNPSIASQNFDITVIKNDTNKLIEFTKKIVEIEKGIFSVSERLKHLYFIHSESSLDALASFKVLVSNKKNELDEMRKEYDGLKKENPTNDIKESDIPMKKPQKPSEVKEHKYKHPDKPQEPILKKANLFNKKKITAENNLAIEKYNKNLETYEKMCENVDKMYQLAIEQYNKECALYEQAMSEYQQAVSNLKTEKTLQHNKKIENCRNTLEQLEKEYHSFLQDEESVITPEKAKNEIVEQEIKQAEELLAKMCSARNDMYGYGVIFEKYCNFVAISSFCEYLSSGRCTQLEGADGAYNLYESELRSDMIIGQLNYVIDSLEQIQKNQFMIYSAINETTKQLADLNSSMDKAVSSINAIKSDVHNMKDYMEDIAANTAVSAYYSQVNAYYSKKNAELTNALGFMVALK